MAPVLAETDSMMCQGRSHFGQIPAEWGTLGGADQPDNVKAGEMHGVKQERWGMLVLNPTKGFAIYPVCLGEQK